VCDAKETEPVYFNNFIGRDKPLKVKIVTDAAGKGYSAMVKEAERARDKHAKGYAGKWTLWCVSDVDVDPNTPGSREAKTKELREYDEALKKKEFRLALSNPCFELWYLLHFTYTTAHFQDYEAIKTQQLDKANRLPGYEKPKNYWSVLGDKANTAIANAKELKKHHEDLRQFNPLDVSCNPYTNVWELVEELIKP